MQVNCYNTDCMYLTVFNTCEKDGISIDYKCKCRSFERYTKSKEYLYPYYIAVKMANGEKGRVLRYGKKLTIFGYTFFTNDNYKLAGEQSRITEERTGFAIESIARLKANFEKFIMLESKEPSCDSFPLCEYDEFNEGYMPKKEGGVTIGI